MSAKSKLRLTGYFPWTAASQTWRLAFPFPLVGITALLQREFWRKHRQYLTGDKGKDPSSALSQMHPYLSGSSVTVSHYFAWMRTKCCKRKVTEEVGRDVVHARVCISHMGHHLPILCLHVHPICHPEKPGTQQIPCLLSNMLIVY